MVRPSQEQETTALTDAESLQIGDGTSVDGDEGIDFDGGEPGGVITPPAAEILEVVTASGAAVEIDFNVANWWDITLTDDCTLTIVNAPASGLVGLLHVILRQGSGAPWTVTWPASVQWPDTDGTAGGPDPDLWTVEGAINVIVLTTEDGGVSYGGTYDSESTPVPGSTPFIVVTDEGMVGDDSTDNTTAFQAIIDGLSGGELIYFPPGIYRITGTVDIDVDQVQLWGAGGEYSPSVIRMMTSNTTALNFPNALAANQMGASLVRGLWIKGPGSASSGDGIYALAGVNVENCTITGFYVGLHWDHETYYHRATGCFFSGNAHAATQQDGVNNTLVGDCRVHNSGGPSPSGTGAGAFGHIIYGSIGARVRGGTVEQCTVDGIYLDANFSVSNDYTLNTSIEDVYFETAGGSATSFIRIGASGTDVVYDTVIRNCYLQGGSQSTMYAIDADYADRVTIEGTSIGNTGSGSWHAIRGSANAQRLLLLNTHVIFGSVAWANDMYELAPDSPPLTSGDAAGGDLAGTYPNPTVDAVQGVTVTDAGTTGDVLTKTGASTATWSTPSAPASTGVGAILISDTPSTPLVFADLIQNEAQDDLVYADI